jgi:hypothetical protein
VGLAPLSRNSTEKRWKGEKVTGKRVREEEKVSGKTFTKVKRESCKGSRDLSHAAPAARNAGCGGEVKGSRSGFCPQNHPVSSFLPAV